MTYWLHAFCVDCKVASPPLLVTFNEVLSLYPLYEADKSKGGEWIAEHAAACHDVRLVHENDDRFPGDSSS